MLTPQCAMCGHHARRADAQFCGQCGTRLPLQVTVRKKSSVASEKRHHAIAGMVFSLLVGVVIVAHDSGLVHWSTRGADRVAVVKSHVIATVREWRCGGEARRYLDTIRPQDCQQRSADAGDRRGSTTAPH
jgi:hypothetical protein